MENLTQQRVIRSRHAHSMNTELLKHIPLFTGLSDDVLATITAHAAVRAYRKNTIILDRGDETSSLFVVISGKVKIYIADADGKEVMLSEQGPGQYFGELALLSNSPRTASAITLEESRIMVLSKAEFKKCLSLRPDISLNLIYALVERVCALTDNVSDLALLDIYGRVVKVLLKNAEEKNGVQVIDDLSQQGIASRVGASRAMVNRIFKDLKTGGYISIKGKSITIHKRLPEHW